VQLFSENAENTTLLDEQFSELQKSGNRNLNNSNEAIPKQNLQ